MKRRLLYILAAVFAVLQAFSQTSVSYTYDNLNRLTKATYSNGVTVTYTYDALGNRQVHKVVGASSLTYTISVSVTPPGSGTVTGGGVYSSGATAELNAIANAGFKFYQWSDSVTDNPRTITVTRNMNYIAEFRADSVSSLFGDIVIDGKVDNLDLNALLNAYLSDTEPTSITDLDDDSSITMADVTRLISVIRQNQDGSGLNSNGHEYIDLGLPSGTLWATCNVGAEEPEEAGDFYAWGEVETKEDYSWETYRWCDGTKPSSTNASLTKYCDRGGYGLIDGKITLEPEDDVAHQLWGGDWHIPTQEDFQELADYCTIEWITLSNGTDAYQFTGPNGQIMIMPAAGYRNGTSFYNGDFNYWSAGLHMNDNPANNHGTHIDVLIDGSRTSVELTGYYRYRGYSVRPVLSKYTPVVHAVHSAPDSYMGRDLVDLGLPSSTLWATCNLGALSPEDSGCYYSWGETSGSCDGKSSFGFNDYVIDKTESVEPGENLESYDDAAAVNLGGEWRMPTLSELRELINTRYTNSVWTTENGVNGYRITSIVKGFEGNSIFLPAAGYYDGSVIESVGEMGNYWSSTLYGDHDVANNVGHIYFNSSQLTWWEEMPWYGLTIRPVVSIKSITE